MLTVDHLTKYLPGFSLRDISFELPSGYIMGLIGPNAAGKSTLTKSLLNIYPYDAGTVTVDGYDLKKEEVKAKECIGTVLDENFYEENLSALDNANFFGSFYPNYSKDEFIRYCKRFDLDMKKYLKKYSKGMHMKFQLAFALSHNAKILLLDEPTASLDPKFRKELLSILTDLISDGEHSVLLSTHLTDELDRIADYITFINKGTLVFSSSCENLKKNYSMVVGEDYKINLISKELVLWKESSAYHTKALIMRKRFTVMPDNLEYIEPTVEDIMYAMMKGGYADDKARF